MQIRTLAMAATAVLVGGSAFAMPPPLPKPPAFSDAVFAAHAELDACNQIGTKSHLFGEVVVRFDPRTKIWKTSASKSLGALAGPLQTCVRDAIKKHFVGASPSGRNEHAQLIGTPVILLPTAAKLLPIWRRALAPGADAKAARAELAKLVPVDYVLTPELCFKSDQRYTYDADILWLATAGEFVPRMWHKLLPTLLGPQSGQIAMWSRSGEFVVKDSRGVCLVPFDASKQAALRAQFDTLGTCWAGSFEDILLHPKIAFPTDRSYVQVSTNVGRACALTTTGTVTCCGNTEPALAAAPSGLRALALGYAFGCGLDASQRVVCWGAIDPPPSGKFVKVSASYQHACGLRDSGEIACWGKPNYEAKPPAGAFVDVAASTFSSCGVHKDGSVECWGQPQRETKPPGSYTAVSASWTHACGLRRDHTAGCWTDPRYVVSSPGPDKLVQLDAAGPYEACGLHDDGTLACWGAQPQLPGAHMAAPPAGKFVQISGATDMTCGVRDSHAIDCWGDIWPGTWLGDNDFFYAKYIAGAPAYKPPARLSGHVVDESGKPVAGAEVLVCGELSGPCDTVYFDAARKPGALADRIAALANVDAKTFALVTTAADGSWSAPNPTPGAKAQLVFAARGRELLRRSAFDPVSEPWLDHLTLRPVSTLDIVATCDGSPCTGPIMMSVAAYEQVDGTHVEQLSPGVYRVEVRARAGQSGERFGRTTVEVGFTGNPLRVPLALAASGTGKSIAGTLTLTTGGSPDGQEVAAKCGADGTTRRTAKADAKGAFVITDVGAPPCTVEPTGGTARSPVTVTKLPATGVRIESEPIQMPRR